MDWHCSSAAVVVEGESVNFAVQIVASFADVDSSAADC